MTDEDALYAMAAAITEVDSDGNFMHNMCIFCGTSMVVSEYWTQEQFEKHFAHAPDCIVHTARRYP